MFLAHRSCFSRATIITTNARFALNNYINVGKSPRGLGRYKLNCYLCKVFVPKPPESTVIQYLWCHNAFSMFFKAILKRLAR